MSSFRQVGGGRATYTCLLIEKVDIIRIRLSKYQIYFASVLVKVLNILSHITENAYRIYRRRAFRFVAVAVSSGSVDEPTTVTGPGGCLDIVRLKGNLLVEG